MMNIDFDLSQVPMLDGMETMAPGVTMAVPEERSEAAKYRSLELSEEEQTELLSLCNEFKRETDDAYGEKRESMKTAYAYYKMQFLGEGIDLLPMLGPEGLERDIETERPKVFLPITRQIIVQLYSQIKLGLHPQDDGYMRLKGKDEDSAEIEDELTAAFQEVLERMTFTELMGRYYLNMAIFGGCPNYPCIDVDKQYEWRVNPITNRYEMAELPPKPELALKIWSPMNFSPDPSQPFGDRSKWVYTEYKKKQELLDSELYFNKDKIRELERKREESSGRDNDNRADLRQFTGVNRDFRDSESIVRYDLYYMPFMQLKSGKEIRNMLIGIAEDTVVVRYFPNIAPKGMNPVVYCDWRPDPESPLGDGPAEDVREIQRMINMLENYKLESLARNGNRWAIPYGADTDSLFGVSGGICWYDPQIGPPVAMSGDLREIGALQNTIGILKSEAQIVTGANQPFQGAANLDFQKTATELSIINEGAMTIMREIIEHAAIIGLKKTLEMMRRLAAEVYRGEEITIRRDDENGDSEFTTVDLSQLGSDDFEVEITSSNPSMGKSQQIEVLREFMALAAANPSVMAMLKSNGWHLLKLIMNLMGVKNMEFAKSPYEIRQDVNEMMAQQMAMAQQGGMQGGGSQFGAI